MITYGLCGKTLKHSYSKLIHEKLGNSEYRLLNLEKDEFYELLESRSFKACNVTIPYKKDAYSLCTVLSKEAQSIGSVNTVVNKNGVLYGYNTDYAGFEYMLRRAGITLENKNVIILGTGGTSLTAQAVAKDSAAKSITVVSRTGKVNYNNVYDKTDTEVIINTTPVGMYPDNGRCAVDVSKFPKLCAVVDVIYNPLKTKILADAQKLGIKNTGGLPMLVYQAVKAHELFFDTEVPADVPEKILSECLFETANIVLVGMPGCGKTSIGTEIAKKLGRVFLDTDKFVEQSGLTIPEIFERYGEKDFRNRETEAVKMLTALSGKVIATGGGSVLDSENVRMMHQNGIAVYIKRPLDKLATDGRPLSDGGMERLQKLFEQRREVYQNVSDIEVETDGDIQKCAENIIDGVKKNIAVLCPGNAAEE